MRAVALTDHGNMFGAITLYKAAKEAGVQADPRLRAQRRRRARRRTAHRTCRCSRRRAEGYKNLVRLVSRGHVEPASQLGARASRSTTVARAREGAHRADRLHGRRRRAGDPRSRARGAAAQALATLRDVVRARAASTSSSRITACPSSRSSTASSSTLARDARPAARRDQRRPLRRARGRARRTSTSRASRRAARTRRRKERHHGSSEMYLKSPRRDGAALLGVTRRDRGNTLRDRRALLGLKLKLGKPMLPSFHVPEGYDTDGYFRHVAREGLERRFGELDGAGQDGRPRRRTASASRSSSTSSCKMKFPGYFLIVWDFIRYAKENGIPVGPGPRLGRRLDRRVRDADHRPRSHPVQPALRALPESGARAHAGLRRRLLHGPARRGHRLRAEEVRQDERRADRHVPRAQGARASSRTSARAHGHPADRGAADREPHPAARRPAETYTIAEALEIEPKLKALLRHRADGRASSSTQAQKLEGLTRHAGMHAAGVVISEGPLWDHVPCFKDGKTDAFVTQYYKDDVEQAGLVKFDFLGLKTLTVIDIARAPHQRAARSPAREASSFDLGAHPARRQARPTRSSASGETTGVFQLESSGMQQLFKDLKPDVLRGHRRRRRALPPRPARHRHGRRTSSTASTARSRSRRCTRSVDELLAPTYGVIVYQEQVMQIAQQLAGYTLGGADLLRRAMGKKKPEEMAKQKSIFVDGALEQRRRRRRTPSASSALLEFFAGYGFNKSHSAAYALITYQTAYLKAHYPVEFLCALMTSDKDKIEKVVRTIAEARAMGVTVLPPDINESETDFTVVYTHPDGRQADRARERERGRKDPLGPQIRFGLGAVRGLGDAALEAMFEARERGGPFRDLFDFAARVDAKRVNKGVLRGARAVRRLRLDARRRGASRARAPSRRSTARSSARAREPRSRARADDPLRPVRRGAAQARGARRTRGRLRRSASPGIAARLLVREQQALGFYVSGHPLERYVKGDAAARASSTRVPIADVRRHGRLGGREARGHGRGLPRAHLQGRRRQGRVLRARGPDRAREREGPRHADRARTRTCSRAASRCSSRAR